MINVPLMTPVIIISYVAPRDQDSTLKSDAGAAVAVVVVAVVVVAVVVAVLLVEVVVVVCDRRNHLQWGEIRSDRAYLCSVLYGQMDF